MKLRPYQESAIELLRESLRTGHRTPLLYMPTGAGKTAVAGEIIKMARQKDKKVGFIVDRLTLVDQASKHLSGVGIDHGIIQGNNPFTDYAKPVQVISVQTMARRRPWGLDMGINDEAHVVFKAHKKLMQTWNNVPFIGLSASPFTDGLGLVYDDLIVPTTISELIEDKYLVDADAYGPSQPDMKGVQGGSDFNQNQAAERANTTKLVASIIETWHKLAKGRQTICFATNVAHSKHIVERFQASGVRAEHIDAYTDSPQRREYIRLFANNEIQILSSVGVLTTGFDAPNAEVAILARPTRSLMLHIQMIGRILRPYEGKERGLILDHSGNIQRLGFHTDPLPLRLSMKVEGEKEEPKPKEDLPKPCPKCDYLKPPKVHKCPSCGFEPVPQPNVHESAGELQKLKKKANKELSWDQKTKMMAGFKHYALMRGYKDGWAAHAYKERLGVWPNDPRVRYAEPVEPDEFTMKQIKYLQIKRAKRHEKKKASSTHREAVQ